MVSYGKSQQVVDEYITGIDGLSKLQLRKRSDRFGTQAVRFVGIELRDGDGMPILQAAAGQDVVLAIEYESEPRAVLHDVEIGIYVRGAFEERICMLSTTVTGADLFREIPSHGIVLCQIPRLPLQPGRYSASLTCHVAGEIADAINGAFVLDVEVAQFFKSGRLPATETGLMLVDHAWQLAARNGVPPEARGLLTRGLGGPYRQDAISTATLHGLCVLDLTTTIAGPHSTRLLADLGAGRKIESRRRPHAHATPLRDGASSYFGELKASESIVLELSIRDTRARSKPDK